MKIVFILLVTIILTLMLFSSIFAQKSSLKLLFFELYEKKNEKNCDENYSIIFNDGFVSLFKKHKSLSGTKNASKYHYAPKH